MRLMAGVLLGLFMLTAAMAADFRLSSKAYKDDGEIPLTYTCHGDNISPQLAWSGAPANTQSFAIILSSPDWSAGFAYLWVIYNIPKDVAYLDEGANRNLPGDTMVGTNWYNEQNYRGPCPPDHYIHHYVFTIYALDTMLDLSGGADGDQVLGAMASHILKQAKYTGVFKH